MKIQPYKSCNCFMCNQGRNKYFKSLTHRAFRRANKHALKQDKVEPSYVSGDYSD